MERITRAHPAEPFVVFIPIVLAVFVYGLVAGSLSWYAHAAVYAGGYLFWTLSEYLLHRYLFHYEPTSEFGKKQMRLIHGIHHQFPSDTDRLVIPPTIGFVVGAIFFGLYTLVLGFWPGSAFWAGWVTGYMSYDFVHWSTHHRKPLTFIGRAQRRRHLLHHFKYPNACYGVSTGLWDWVFGTTADKATMIYESGHPEGVWEVIDNKRR
jgi:sterol desaturase/sphingolipid hydroxylase (fatty acid hydroxylase superfamily)